MEQVRKYAYDEILEKQNLLEEIVVRYENEKGIKIANHLNVFNSLICQLTSMDVKIDDEDKAVNLLCTLPESWGQVVSSISLSTTDTLEFDNVVGALLSKELRKKTSLESPLLQKLWLLEVNPKRKEKIQEVLPGLNRRVEREN